MTTSVLVIGAGVVGLACAQALSKLGFEVVIAEKAKEIASEASSRNSGVIHAGIYYKAESQKQIHCLAGRKLLYEYCRNFGISFNKTGKLIVASDEAELSRLISIKKNAELCSVNLSLISSSSVKELEPELEVAGALLSHETGIVNVGELCNSLLFEAEAHGALLALNTEVTRLQNVGRKVLVQSETTSDNNELEFDYVVNAAGLGAHKLIHKSVDYMLRPPKLFAKGNYFSVSGSAPFSRLVYPLPEKDGLGIHYTLDTQGNCYLGPDVEWVEAPNYHVDLSREIKFRQNVKKYWPGIEDRTLNAAYAGVRPKINIGDFVFHRDKNILSLLGIESPGVTSSLSIAASVKDALLDHFEWQV